tara:strand:+ start:317 stop:1213 length:897 start_codon:yes stop_codon:yes gene_type:complete
MATVTLGNIKLNWKGAYNAGTAYAIDDVVSYNGSSYVAKTATTGNLPTVTANWDIMSQAGTNGTNGTDLTSTLTTQGDIVYRDGSGLARLGYGTAGQVLQTGGSGANPSWTTMSSDVVKVGSGTFSGDAGQLDIDGYFSSTYRIYKLFISNMRPQNSNVNPRFRIRTGGSVYSASQYRHFHDHWYGTNTSGTENIHTSGSYPDDYFHLAGTNSTPNSVNDGTPTSAEIVLFDPLTTTEAKSLLWQAHTHETGGTHGGQLNGWHAVGSVNNTTAMSGLTFFYNSGNIKTMNWQLYGFKH